MVIWMLWCPNRCNLPESLVLLCKYVIQDILKLVTFAICCVLLVIYVMTSNSFCGMLKGWIIQVLIRGWTWFCPWNDNVCPFPISYTCSFAVQSCSSTSWSNSEILHYHTRTIKREWNQFRCRSALWTIPVAAFCNSLSFDSESCNICRLVSTGIRLCCNAGLGYLINFIINFPHVHRGSVHVCSDLTAAWI